MQYLFGITTFITSLFLILLILVQRGRGGGLAGAFGGMGGQSAFGTKAGDLFTRITIVVAAFWILLSVVAIKVLNQSHSVFGDAGAGSVFGGGTDTGKSGASGASDSEAKSNASTTDAPAGTPAGDAQPAAATSGKTAEAPAAEAPAAEAPAAEAPAADAPASAAPTAGAPPETVKDAVP